jgi:hydroxyacylglutathione hydrolase
MFFQQMYLGCLAQASYLIGSKGEAAVVDPRRDVDEYIDEARRNGLAIRHVIETHLHADFVSGHQELARRTGARISIGARAGAGFDHAAVAEGDEIAIGDVTLRFLETPGHTPESVCVLVIDRSESDAPVAVLTGDTLFIGDVGRPDLLGAAAAAEDLAGDLYDSLHGRLLTLDDAVRVYPAHGAGSLCGKNISQERSSTIGEQRRTNPALAPMSRAEFVRRVTADLPEAPGYFRRDVELNRRGASSLADLPPLDSLTPRAVEDLLGAGAAALDVREAPAFGSGHLPGSFEIGLSGQFASWAGAILPPDAPIVLVAADAASADQARLRLARVGLENVVGRLEGGVESWRASGRPLASTEQIDVSELRRRLEAGVQRVVDVRRPGERESARIDGAIPIPLHQLASRAGELDASAPVATICAGGYRSAIAASVLERAGFTKTANVVGGMDAWTGSGFPTRVGSGALNAS